MNILQLHNNEKEVSAIPVFKANKTTAIAIHIKKGEQLKEHITKVSAFLVCLSGNAVFENETGFSQSLVTGDFIEIEPMVKHWINALEASHFILVKS